MKFVVVNITAGSVEEWINLLSIDGGEFGTFGASGAAPVLYSSRREGWTSSSPRMHLRL